MQASVALRDKPQVTFSKIDGPGPPKWYLERLEMQQPKHRVYGRILRACMLFAVRSWQILSKMAQEVSLKRRTRRLVVGTPQDFVRSRCVLLQRELTCQLE